MGFVFRFESNSLDIGIYLQVYRTWSNLLYNLNTSDIKEIFWNINLMKIYEGKEIKQDAKL